MLNVPSDFALRMSKSVLMFAIKVDIYGLDLTFYANYVQTISTKKTSQECEVFHLKWSHLESNQAPTDYESVALTE